jgi:hypothetical protein
MINKWCVMLQRTILCISLFLLSLSLSAHEGVIRGKVTDSASGKPIPYVSLLLQGINSTQTATSDETGNFKFTGIAEGHYTLTSQCLGFKPMSCSLFFRNDANAPAPVMIKLVCNVLDLGAITVTGTKELSQTMNTINQLDMLLRPVNSAQDLMRLVPGLFLAQHQGGGKAEQIFLRGFDADHGTDFAVVWDGIGVNMPSHAHGQGYADMHFVIPETIDHLDVFKGTYTARFGDFATAGAGEFITKNHAENMVNVEYGQYNSHRIMGLINLLGKDQHLFTKLDESFYIAMEDYYNQASYFTNPQNYNRFNFFAKYYGLLTSHTSLAVTASYFGSSWNGSGQIPQRAISEGVISRFGSLDNSEGGQSDRTNANVILKTVLGNDAIFKNQVYYSYYQFNLFTNFTFFLKDSIHGDEINQREKGRSIAGYSGSYEFSKEVGGRNLQSVIGWGTRNDQGETALRHCEKRVILDTLVMGNLFEQNANVYLDETYTVNKKCYINGGLRADYFYFRYTTVKGAGDSVSGQTSKMRVSPKLNLYYTVNPNVQLFVRSGYGFHSNDARAVVTNATGNTLPYALGYEAGSVFKPIKKMLVNAVVWGLYLQNELTYNGDDGTIAINGPTQRYGADLSVRYQLTRVLFADLDVNYSHGRFTGLAGGENYIPLAPTLTSVAGITLKQEKGFNASLRYRYIDDRPANENNSIRATGYFLMDALSSTRCRAMNLVSKWKIYSIQHGMKRSLKPSPD